MSFVFGRFNVIKCFKLLMEVGIGLLNLLLLRLSLISLVYCVIFCGIGFFNFEFFRNKFVKLISLEIFFGMLLLRVVLEFRESLISDVMF